MAYGTPADPVGGTVITVAYAVTNLLDPIRWLRILTGNADPPGSSYVVVSTSTTGTSWQKVPSDAIAPGAITTVLLADLGVTAGKLSPGVGTAGYLLGMAGAALAWLNPATLSVASAVNATTATNAVNATTATNAVNATTAGHASTADSATSATTATNAGNVTTSIGGVAIASYPKYVSSSYAGNNAGSRAISPGFVCKFVALYWTSGGLLKHAILTSTTAANNMVHIQGSPGINTPALVAACDAAGFVVGASDDTNTSGITYGYVAFG
jgi:hypothetical protein